MILQSSMMGLPNTASNQRENFLKGEDKLYQMKMGVMTNL